MKTLENFLKKHNACKDGYDFAKNMTLQEFLQKCQRGDWILWLFAKMNPEKLRELTLAKGHCADTVRQHMKDETSIKAVDTAIAFGEGRATREELDEVARTAYAADAYAYAAATAAFAAADAYAAAWVAASAAAAAAYDAASDAADAASIENQKLTADICRKYLPLEIWDLTQL